MYKLYYCVLGDAVVTVQCPKETTGVSKAPHTLASDAQRTAHAQMTETGKMATSNGGGMEVDQTGEISQTHASSWPELYNNTQQYAIIHTLASRTSTEVLAISTFLCFGKRHKLGLLAIGSRSLRFCFGWTKMPKVPPPGQNLLPDWLVLTACISSLFWLKAPAVYVRESHWMCFLTSAEQICSHI